MICITAIVPATLMLPPMIQAIRNVAKLPVNLQVSALTTLRPWLSFKAHLFSYLGGRNGMYSIIEHFLLYFVSYISSIGYVGDVGHYQYLILSLIQGI